MSNYVTETVAAQALGITHAQLRYCSQAGYVSPSRKQKGQNLYSLADLAGVKLTHELLERSASPHKIRDRLRELRVLLPTIAAELHRACIIANEDGVSLASDHHATRVNDILFALGDLNSAAAGQEESSQTSILFTSESSPYELFRTALDFEAQGDTQSAKLLYRQALRVDDRMAAAWTNLGNLMDQEGDAASARSAYEKAIEIDPEQPEARYNLANQLADQGEAEMALAEYRRVTLLAPDFADAYFNMGLLAMQSDSAAAARSHFSRYCEIDNDATSHWHKLAKEMLDSLL